MIVRRDPTRQEAPYLRNLIVMRSRAMNAAKNTRPPISPCSMILMHHVDRQCDHSDENDSQGAPSSELTCQVTNFSIPGKRNRQSPRKTGAAPFRQPTKKCGERNSKGRLISIYSDRQRISNSRSSKSERPDSRGAGQAVTERPKSGAAPDGRRCAAHGHTLQALAGCVGVDGPIRTAIPLLYKRWRLTAEIAARRWNQSVQDSARAKTGAFIFFGMCSLWPQGTMAP